MDYTNYNLDSNKEKESITDFTSADFANYTSDMREVVNDLKNVNGKGYDDDQLNFYIHLLHVEEDLHEELSAHIRTDNGQRFLEHPVLFWPNYREGLNAFLNYNFNEKIALCRSSIDDGDFEEYVFQFERQYRLHAFQDIANQLDDISYWKLLRKIWEHSENHLQDPKIWFGLLTSDRLKKHLFMDKDERRAFDKLPDEIDVKRQFGSDQTGLLYSISEEKGSKYTHLEPFKSIKLKIKKKDMFAYLFSQRCKTIIALTEINL